MTLADAYELIESALQAPADERAYFIRQALAVLPDDHAAREPIQNALEGELPPVAGLRVAYGELPPGPDECDAELAAVGCAGQDDDGPTPESEAAAMERAADQLAAATFALEDVDLKPLLDEEVRTVLDSKGERRGVCHRLRHDHHALEDRR